MTDEMKVSADAIGHMQRMEDLPAIGTKVRAVWFDIDVSGEVFSHVPHPTSPGWGFALIRFV